MSSSNYVHVEVAQIMRETDAAFLCKLKNEKKEVWLPKSQIADSENYEEGDVDVTLSITEWIANEKGIEE